MRGAQKRHPARPALWGLTAALVLIAGTAIAGEPAEPATVGPAERPAESVAPPDADGEETAADGRWSYLRPRFADSGLRVHIDPQTGTAVTPPDKAQREVAVPAAFNRSHAGLKVVTLPNGYRYVDARGRLINALTATVGEDGEVAVGHAPPAAADAEAAAEDAP